MSTDAPSTQSTQSTVNPSTTVPSSAAVSSIPSTQTEGVPFTTAPATPTSTTPTRMERFKKWIEKNKLKWINFGIAGGIGFGVYSIYAFGFDLIDFYLEHREIDAPYLAFFTGAGCTILSMGLYRLTRRFFVLNSGRMYREVLRTVFNHPDVRMRLGEDVRQKTLQRMKGYATSRPAASASTTTSVPSPARLSPSYRYVSYLPAKLRYRKDKDGWARYWQPRRLQMSFWIEGSSGGGIVTAEVEQMLRGEFDDVNVCIVDLLESGEQLIVKSHTQPGKANSDILSVEEEKTGISRERDLLSNKVQKY